MALMIAPLPSLAATSTFTDAAAFALAVPGATAQNFEAATFDGTTIAFAGGSVACSGGTFCGSFYGLNNGAGFALSGVNAPFFGTPDTLTFSFSQPLRAFGIYIGGAGNLGSQSLTATLSTGETLPVLTDYSNSSGNFERNTEFFGFVTDTPFSTIAFAGVRNNDGVYFDDASYAFASTTVVPVPGAALLMAGGLLSIGAVGMRRRKA